MAGIDMFDMPPEDPQEGEIAEPAGIDMFVMPPMDPQVVAQAEEGEIVEEPVPYKVFPNTALVEVRYMISALRGIPQRLMRPVMKNSQDIFERIPGLSEPLYDDAQRRHKLYFYFPNDPAWHEAEAEAEAEAAAAAAALNLLIIR